jgi:very-short-patch-repair endonuclease
MVVEADGHDYHDRTREQASRDRRRDRFMQANGWIVARFTGADIHRDADACAREVFNMMLRAR